MNGDAQQYPARLSRRADPAGIFLMALGLVPAGILSVLVDLYIWPLAPSSRLLWHALAFAVGILPGLLIVLSALRVRVDVSRGRIVVNGVLLHQVIEAVDVVTLGRVGAKRALALTTRDNARLLLYPDKSVAVYDELVARLSAEYSGKPESRVPGARSVL